LIRQEWAAKIGRSTHIIAINFRCPNFTRDFSHIIFGASDALSSQALKETCKKNIGELPQILQKLHFS
jgi:hypothetical protein